MDRQGNASGHFRDGHGRPLVGDLFVAQASRPEQLLQLRTRRPGHIKEAYNSQKENTLQRSCRETCNRLPCLQIFLFCIGVLVLLPLGGCSTHAKRLATPRTMFYDGRLEECRTSLIKLEKSRHDRDIVNLDLAMVDLVNGDPKKAESRLKVARDRFDELEGPALAEKAVSLWTDDQIKSYEGEDYEKILIRAFLALSNLLHDGTDAESYSLQLQEKHKQLVQDRPEPTDAHKPQTYRPLPLGFYLRGMLREATHRDYDDAIRNYEIASSLLPNSLPFQWDLNRARDGIHSQPGNGVIYVFALVGKGPYKVEVTEQPTSDALLIADRIVSAAGPYKLPPTIAPIKIPDIAVPASDIDGVGVSIQGQMIGPTETITNIESLAMETYQAKRTAIVAQAVARRVVKKATIATAKKTMKTDSLASVGMDLAGIAWEATEGADTRCWGLLPREIQVMRVEAPRGSVDVQLTPLLRGRPVGSAKSTRVEVTDGRNTYLLCWFPDARSAEFLETGTAAERPRYPHTTQRPLHTP